MSERPGKCTMCGEDRGEHKFTAFTCPEDLAAQKVEALEQQLKDLKVELDRYKRYEVLWNEHFKMETKNLVARLKEIGNER